MASSAGLSVSVLLLLLCSPPNTALREEPCRIQHDETSTRKDLTQTFYTFSVQCGSKVRYVTATLTGVNSILNAGDLRWNNAGTEAESAMFKSDEPNNSGDCVRLVRHFGGTDLGSFYLADHPCTSSYRPFCEKPSSPGITHSKKLTALPSNLCSTKVYVTSGVLSCAGACARESTSCYIYAYEKATRMCSFHRLSNSCANSGTLMAGVSYYRVTRACT